MMAENCCARRWAVITVSSGIIVDVRLWPDIESAERCERLIREQMDHIEDETVVFEISESGQSHKIIFLSNRPDRDECQL